MWAESELARTAWEAWDSWSRLRAYWDGTRWPTLLKQIHQDVRGLPGGQNATQERIHELIKLLLFQTPPTEEEVSGLTLQQCLVERLTHG